MPLFDNPKTSISGVIRTVNSIYTGISEVRKTISSGYANINGINRHIFGSINDIELVWDRSISVYIYDVDYNGNKSNGTWKYFEIPQTTVDVFSKTVEGYGRFNIETNKITVLMDQAGKGMQVNASIYLRNKATGRKINLYSIKDKLEPYISVYFYMEACGGGYSRASAGSWTYGVNTFSNSSSGTAYQSGNSYVSYNNFSSSNCIVILNYMARDSSSYYVFTYTNFPSGIRVNLKGSNQYLNVYLH